MDGSCAQSGRAVVGWPLIANHWPLPSEYKFQAELNLTRSEGGVGLQETLGLLVVGRIENSVDIGGVLRECGGLDGESAGSDLDALVVAVEEVE